MSRSIGLAVLRNKHHEGLDALAVIQRVCLAGGYARCVVFQHGRWLFVHSLQINAVCGFGYFANGLFVLRQGLADG
ncbi:MAG: hypothetical protein K1W05_06380 [Desulfovibrio sp.]